MLDECPRPERQGAVRDSQHRGTEPLARRYPAMIVRAVIGRWPPIIDRRNPDLRGAGRQRQQGYRQPYDADQ